VFIDGTYHVGWWKESYAYGYGIGNAFSKADEGVREGLWERDRLVEGELKLKAYTMTDPCASKFTLEKLFMAVEKPEALKHPYNFPDP